jgi:hypothetical protein
MSGVEGAEREDFDDGEVGVTVVRVESFAYFDAFLGTSFSWSILPSKKLLTAEFAKKCREGREENLRKTGGLTGQNAPVK